MHPRQVMDRTTLPSTCSRPPHGCRRLALHRYRYRNDAIWIDVVNSLTDKWLY